MQHMITPSDLATRLVLRKQRAIAAEAPTKLVYSTSTTAAAERLAKAEADQRRWEEAFYEDSPEDLREQAIYEYVLAGGDPQLLYAF